MSATRPAPTLSAELPGGEWRVWRWVALRGAGFPVSILARLADQDLASRADAAISAELAERAALDAACGLLRELGGKPHPATVSYRKTIHQIRAGKNPVTDGLPDDAVKRLEELAVARARIDETRRELAAGYEASCTKLSLAVQDIARDPRMREAVTWQNPGVIRAAFDALLRKDPIAIRAKDRRREMLVASYAQRYCAKNDTIGFFGPVGWATIDDDGAALALDPRAMRVSRRTVYFEQWGIDTLAAKLSSDTRLAPWMIPRRMPFLRIDGRSVHSAVNGRHELTEAEAAILGACEGTRTARELGLELGVEEPTLFSTLRDLREKQLVAWAFEVPLGAYPDRRLRQLLARIDDDALRAEAMAPLDELEEHARAVARAAGDAAALDAAFDALGSTFTRVAASAATQQAGRMYAGRELVFEDCMRAGEAKIGPSLLESLGPALSLVLASARWLTHETARVYGAAFRTIHDDLLRRSKTGGPVRFADVWFRAQRLFFGSKERPVDGVIKSLRERWTAIVAAAPEARSVMLDSATIRPRVLEAFDAPGPGWKTGRHHSPDIMIAADGIDAICRGDVLFVLGEAHAGINTIDCAVFSEQHPRPADLFAATELDLPGRLVAPASYSKDWPGNTVRTVRSLLTPSTYLLESGFDRAPDPRERILRLGDLHIEDRDGALVVPLGDGGPPVPLIEIFAEPLVASVMSEFRFLPASAHAPRVQIDNLVISRESWTLAPSRMSFASERDDAWRFVAARRWARELGIPRFFFAKAAVEVKPIFVDLDSPIFVAMFSKLVRAAAENVSGETPVTLTEMLPRLDQSWLEGEGGERYTSELRFVAVDPRA